MKRKLRLLMSAILAVMMLTVICAAEEAQIVASGQCGDNATWTLTEDNILRIEGTGAIWDCHDDAHGCSYCDGYSWNPDGLPGPCTAPDVLWRGNYDVVYISEGITKMGYNAFSCGNHFGTIVYPASVTNLVQPHNGIADEVYYYGTPEQWQALRPDPGEWDYMYTDATIHYATAKYDCLENATHTKVAVCADCGSSINEGAKPCVDENLDYLCDLCGGEVFPEGIIAGGKCGDNVTWSFSEDGVLRIEGSGSMQDFHHDAYSCPDDTIGEDGLLQCDNPGEPWVEYMDQISAVYIAENVTYMGSNSFVDGYDLEYMVYPESITNLSWVWYSDVNEVYYYGTAEQWEVMDWEDSGYDRAKIHYMTSIYDALKGGSHTVTDICSDCGTTLPELVLSSGTETCDDADEDGACDLCGAQIKYISIAGTSVMLGSDLNLRFLIDRSVVRDDHVAKVTHNGKVTEVEIEEYNDTYMAVTYPVAAKEMTDLISVQIYDADGRLVSEPYAASIKQYAMLLLSLTDDADLKTVAVDMLNYGAEAQKYFGYHKKELANADLATEQMQYASDPVEVTNGRIEGENYIGTFLSLENNIRFNTVFNAKNSLGVGGAIVEFTDYRGNVVRTEAKVIPYEEGQVKVVTDRLVFADAEGLITVTLYDFFGNQIGQCQDSVEGYVARMSHGKTADVCAAIMKLATSAKAYLLK